jgi:acetylornithine deacetylase
MSDERDNPEVKAVLDRIDTMSGEIADKLSELIRIPSVNPKYPGQDYDKMVGGEGLVSFAMADLYRRAGAEVEMVTVEKGRDNACARVAGAGSGSSLIFNGHVDVVPAERLESWTYAPFSGLIQDGNVYGRGATDMKGGLVSHAFAAIALAQSGIKLKGDLLLQSVVGEEMGDHINGTTAALEAGYVADAAIVCEPTSFAEEPAAIVPVTPGLLSFKVDLEGKAAHSGLRGLTIHPTLDGEALGVNTIDKYWIVYQALRTLEDEWARKDRHPLFPNGYFGILPAVLKANPVGIYTPLFLADTLTADYCIYHHPDRTNEEIMHEVEATIHRAAQGDTWLRAHPPKVTWELIWPPYTLRDGSPLLETVMSSHERAYAHTGVTAPAQKNGFFGVCDLTWMDRKGIDGLIYGPGVAKTAHAENEYVPVQQLVAAAKTYALAAIAHCGLA